MINPRDNVVWFQNIDSEDGNTVGSTAAGIGAMIQANLPVSPGFVISSYVFNTFFTDNNIGLKLKHILASLHSQHSESKMQIAAHIKNVVSAGVISPETAHTLMDAYHRISGSFKEPQVVVSISGAFKDHQEISDSVRQFSATVSGEAAFLHTVKDIWGQALQHLILSAGDEYNPSQKIRLALLVQQVVQPEVSGYIFTSDPVHNDKNRAIIECVYGSAEYVLYAKVKPDHYETDKKTHQIIEKHINPQGIMMGFSKKKKTENSVPWLKRKRQKISDAIIQQLTEYAVILEKQLFYPQDCEWVLSNGQVYIIKSRQLLLPTEKKPAPLTLHHYYAFAVGEGVSRGVRSGPLRMIANSRDAQNVKTGDVIYIKEYLGDVSTIIKKASAVITEKGGLSSHISYMARQQGKPAVVGVPSLINKIREETILTVNGQTGEIYKGNILARERDLRGTDLEDVLPTRTKVFISLSPRMSLEKAAQHRSDGVGVWYSEPSILKMEFHPHSLIKEGKAEEIVLAVADGLKKAAEHFYPRPVYYRAADFTTDEFHQLRGGKSHDPKENNPLLGTHGAHRTIQMPYLFQQELKAIKHLREKNGLNNIQLMMPFVRSVHELNQLTKITSDKGLVMGKTFSVIPVIEVPASIFFVEQVVKNGYNTIAVDVDRLAHLLLAIDPASEEMMHAYSIQNEAVILALKQIITIAGEHKARVIVFSKSLASYPDLIEYLIEWGVYGITIVPDAIEHVRKIVQRTEKKQHGKN